MASEPDTKTVVYATFSANASPSIIYDCYVEELKRRKKIEKEGGKKKEEKKEDWKYKEEDEEEEDEEEEDEEEEDEEEKEEEEEEDEEEEDEDSQECTGPSEEKDLTRKVRKPKKKVGKFDVSQIAEAAWMMERAVVNNIYADIRDDFMYFEDPADEFRGEKGTLLPLWKFQNYKAKGLSVTALCWSTEFNDLFAVGLGSYGYPHEDPGGMLLFYTVNMHTFPEFFFDTDSGVMCVDIHKSQGHLVAVGFHDGCVAVYSLLRKKKKPFYNSRASSGKHRGPVMQVKWQQDDLNNNHNFFSVSADGRVVSWTLSENELVFTDIIKLPAMDKVPDDLKDVIPTPGISLDFNKKYEFLYLLASQSGTIYKGSIYTSITFLGAYDAHFLMSVMCVRWNPFHSKVFISCGMDRMVKIWNEKMNSPVFTFDLRAGVTDVAWAPYSSTVFAAVTTDGKVHVFDLSVNKYEALCQQVVVSKKKTPVKIEFNPVHPIIIVGDDRGSVVSLKLSPNLRKKPKDKNGQELPSRPEEEMAKIEQLLSLRK